MFLDTLADGNHNMGYKKIGSGSCLNSEGQHPPFEFGTSVNNDPATCFGECKKSASATNRKCTGFDIRPKCAYYFDEEITTTKVATSESKGCYKVTTTGIGFENLYYWHIYCCTKL